MDAKHEDALNTAQEALRAAQETEDRRAVQVVSGPWVFQRRWNRWNRPKIVENVDLFSEKLGNCGFFDRKIGKSRIDLPKNWEIADLFTEKLGIHIV